jgi:hypothetical protein
MEWQPHVPIVNIKGNATTLPIEIPPYSQFYINAGQLTSKNCSQPWVRQ